MALLQWRRFNFFDKELVKTSEGSSGALDQLKDVDISAYTCGRGNIIVGDYKGCVYLLSREMEQVTFKAYTVRVTQLYQLKLHNILVSIGEDDTALGLTIKVWNLDKVDVNGIPACTRIARAIPSCKTTKVTCLAVAENLCFMAVGYENGCIVLFRGDVMRERHSKQRVIYEGNQKVTGLVFKIQGQSQVLFACTEGEVICITLLAKDRDQKAVLDFHGCPLHCSVLSVVMHQDSQFVIARSDAVYFYQPECRGTCLAFEGEKLQVHWYRGYLLIVGRDAKGLRRATGGEGQGLDMNTLTVYDIQNKFIAYTSPIPQVIGVFCEWGSLYVLTGDHKLYQLIEKDTQTKLEVLFKKNLYRQAIDLALSQQYDKNGIVDIYRQYGDHLYSKGDHDGSMLQYIRTIGKLEPSYVIRKFLDAQRIQNLTSYLQALHVSQLATEDHTTLLLNCYTKLKDTTKLNEFFRTKDREVYFDVDTAINVCRSAGYFDHAVSLADEHGHHEGYLKIQLEDIGDHKGALDYISKLDFEEAESNLKKYGEVLMSEAPIQTTDLLKRLCTNYRSFNGNVQKANAEEFIHIFVNNSDELTEFLEHMVKVEPKSSSAMYNSLLELYLQDHAKEQDISVKIQKQRRTLDLLKNPDAGYDIDQALFQCQLNNLKPGILYIYEKAKKFKEILQYHMNHNDYTQVIETCKRYEAQESDLWIQALAYFARKEENCKPQIVEVLNNIDKNNLLAPLLVVQTLAHNSTASLSIVKDYITRRLQAEQDQIEEDSRLIRQYRDDTRRMVNEIDQLKTGAKVFQNQKCSVCSHALELPSVHFLCQHSYHQHCFDSYSDTTEECPVCLPDNRKLLDTIRTQEQSKDLHDQFHNQLQRGPDGFSVIAEYYGRGVFIKTGAPDFGSYPNRQTTSGVDQTKQRRVPFP